MFRENFAKFIFVVEGKVEVGINILKLISEKNLQNSEIYFPLKFLTTK